MTTPGSHDTQLLLSMPLLWGAHKGEMFSGSWSALQHISGGVAKRPPDPAHDAVLCTKGPPQIALRHFVPASLDQPKRDAEDHQ
jgi:hypothetical protein